MSVDSTAQQVIGRQFAGGHDINGAAEHGRQIVVQTEDVHHGGVGGQFYQQIEVGIGTVVTTPTPA